MAENRRLVSIGKLKCNSFLLVWLKRRVTVKSLIEQDWLSGLQVYDSILNHNMRQNFLLFIFLRFPARNKETLNHAIPATFCLKSAWTEDWFISSRCIYAKKEKKSPCWPRDYFSAIYIFRHLIIQFYVET